MKNRSFLRFIITSIIIFGLVVGGTYVYPKMIDYFKPNGEFNDFSVKGKAHIYFFYEEDNNISQLQKFQRLLADFGNVYGNDVAISVISNSHPSFSYYSTILKPEAYPAIVIINPKGYMIFNSKDVIQKEQLLYIVEPYL